MENFIIIGIIVAVAVIGIAAAVKHFKGEGGCCGGGSSYKPRKKKLKKVIAVKVFKVEGMNCEHCQNRVTEVINDIPGVAAEVSLKRGEAAVSYEEAVDDELIRARVQRAGYVLGEVIG